MAASSVRRSSPWPWLPTRRPPRIRRETEARPRRACDRPLFERRLRRRNPVLGGGLGGGRRGPLRLSVRRSSPWPWLPTRRPPSIRRETEARPRRACDRRVLDDGLQGLLRRDRRVARRG